MGARAKRKEQKTHKIHDRKMTEERLQKISERIQKLAREPQSQEQIKQMNRKNKNNKMDQKNRQGQMNQMNRKTKIESEYLDLEKYHSTMSNESKEKETNQKMKNNAENFVDSSLKSTQNNPKVDDSSIDDGLKNNQLNDGQLNDDKLNDDKLNKKLNLTEENLSLSTEEINSDLKEKE